MDASKEAKRRNSLNPNTKSTKYWQWGNVSSMVTENGEGTAIQRLSDDTCHLGRCQLPFMTGLWEGSQAQRNQILVSEWKRHVCHTNNRRGGKDSRSWPTLHSYPVSDLVFNSLWFLQPSEYGHMVKSVLSGEPFLQFHRTHHRSKENSTKTWVILYTPSYCTLFYVPPSLDTPNLILTHYWQLKPQQAHPNYEFTGCWHITWRHF